MGTQIERLPSHKTVSWNNAAQSDPVVIRGYKSFWFINHGSTLTGNMTIQVLRPGTTNTWDTLLDAALATVTIALGTADGLIPLPELPPDTKVRFVVGSAITETTFLVCNS